MSKSLLHAIRACQMAITAAAVCIAVSANAYTVPGGTITFKGALVSPPFALSTQTAEREGGGFSARQIQRGQTTAVAFAAYPNSAPSAQVSLTIENHRATSDALTASFADGKGHRIQPASDGTFHVGASGGVLSIQGKQASPAPVTLVTQYE